MTNGIVVYYKRERVLPSGYIAKEEWARVTNSSGKEVYHGHVPLLGYDYDGRVSSFQPCEDAREFMRLCAGCDEVRFD